MRSHNYSTQTRFSPRCFYSAVTFQSSQTQGNFTLKAQTPPGVTPTQRAPSARLTRGEQCWCTQPQVNARYNMRSVTSKHVSHHSGWQAAEPLQLSLWALNLNNLTRTRGCYCTGEHLGSTNVNTDLHKTHLLLWKFPTHRVLEQTCSQTFRWARQRGCSSCCAVYACLQTARRATAWRQLKEALRIVCLLFCHARQLVSNALPQIHSLTCSCYLKHTHRNTYTSCAADTVHKWRDCFV